MKKDTERDRRNRGFVWLVIVGLVSFIGLALTRAP